MTSTSQTIPLMDLREHVRDFVYDCTRDEFGHGWTLSAQQTDDLIAMVSAALTKAHHREGE